MLMTTILLQKCSVFHAWSWLIIGLMPKKTGDVQDDTPPSVKFQEVVLLHVFLAIDDIDAPWQVAKVDLAVLHLTSSLHTPKFFVE